MRVSRINTPITSAIVAMGKVVDVASNENGDWLDIQTALPGDLRRFNQIIKGARLIE
jgi:hypothetical protein